jgi:hypothetical protein
MYGGLADRMQKEITALAPSSMKVKVNIIPTCARNVITVLTRDRERAECFMMNSDQS